MSSVPQYQTTTVRLPKKLYEQARMAVKDGGAASSINDFLVEAVQDKLQQLREQEIDTAFAAMGSDEEYQKEAVALARSFEQSDWGAYQALDEGTNTHARSRKKSAPKASSR